MNAEIDEKSVIQIFDLQGRLVISENILQDGVQNISISNLQKGCICLK